VCGLPAKLYTIAKDFAVPLTALGWGIFTWIRENRRKLSITQIGSSVTSRVSELEGLYTTTFAVDEVIITNDSPKAKIVIARYAVKPPWDDPEIEALPDPLEASPSSDRYTIHGSYVDHPRDWVINHHRYQHGKLEPGDTIRGTFLAKGNKPIPADLRRNEAIEVEFIVYPTRGKPFRKTMRVFPELVPKV
jgi:hypothetical protein